jgi:hypothetical protein
MPERNVTMVPVLYVRGGGAIPYGGAFMAKYPELDGLLKREIEAIFNHSRDEEIEASYDRLLAGAGDDAPAKAAVEFIALHLAWVTRREAMRRLKDIAVWKNVADWKGVFEAHIHFESDKRERRGLYADLTTSSYTGIVRITPLAGAVNGRFESELNDWSVPTKPYSLVKGTYLVKGNQLKPDPVATRDSRDLDYEDPESAKVKT